MWSEDISTLENISENNLAWLTKPYILSKVYKKIYSTINVELLFQQIADVYGNEREFLQIANDEPCYLRKVILFGDNVPLSYGRVVIPNSTYLANQDKFGQLGANLIGEKLLYNNPLCTRSKFQYREVFTDAEFYKDICAIYTGKLPEKLYSRRSKFYLSNNPLLVTETYITDLPKYPS